MHILILIQFKYNDNTIFNVTIFTKKIKKSITDSKKIYYVQIRLKAAALTRVEILFGLV